MHKDERAKKITGRGVAGKIIVQGLLERGEGDKKSRVKAKKIENRKRETMHAEVRANVEPGSEFFTDCRAA
jgi:hypothetical protein